MMIVDAQIHIWAKGTPSAHHRQEPYSKDQALAGMDAAGEWSVMRHTVHRGAAMADRTMTSIW